MQCTSAAAAAAANLPAADAPGGTRNGMAGVDATFCWARKAADTHGACRHRNAREILDSRIPGGSVICLRASALAGSIAPGVKVQRRMAAGETEFEALVRS